MFPDGENLPLFSGTPIPVIERPFEPEDASMKQAMLPGMPGIDYDRVLELDKARRRRLTTPGAPNGRLLISPPAEEPPEQAEA